MSMSKSRDRCAPNGVGLSWSTLAIAGALWLCPSAPLEAVEVNWRTRNFTYAVEGKPLNEVLRDFAASQGLLLQMEADVDGVVSGRFSSSPERFLDTMAQAYGFVWYFNGATLQITTASAMRSAMVHLSSVTAGKLQGVLERMRLHDRRFPIRYDAEIGGAFVSGPQDYVNLVTEIATQLEKRHDGEDAEMTAVFPLRFARATDRMVPGGTGRQILGVASLLETLYRSREPFDSLRAASAVGVLSRPTSENTGTVVRSVELGSRPVTQQANWPWQAVENSPISRQSPTEPNEVSGFRASTPSGLSTAAQAAVGAGGVQVQTLPVIVADASNNSIVVRDKRSRMSAHERLISQLDKRPQIVEIEAQIIEVEEASLDTLGIQWSGASSQLGAFSTGQAPGGGAAAGNTLSVVMGGAGHVLMARVNALEQRNLARVLARPKVATLSNLEAVMDNRQSYHVRVGGQTAGQLFTVSSGTGFRVLPIVTELDSTRLIRLDVQIDDGKFLASRVDGLPLQSTSRLDTQAILREGQSLLIAGYSVDSTSSETSGLPGTSGWPLLRSLFGSERSASRRLERLFLLTPTIVE